MRLRTEARGNVMESDLALERDLKREAVQVPNTNVLLCASDANIT